MYPSLFPISLKRSWHHGISFPHDNKEDDLNAFMWSRGVAAERGLYSMNLSSLGMGPWIQQRSEPLLLGTEFNQYQAMPSVALQDIRCGDILKQQFLQNQQPIQFIQQSCPSSSLLQQQDYQQTPQQQITNSQPQCLPENRRHPVPYQQLQPLHNEQQKQQAEEAHAYTQSFSMHNNHVQQQANLPSPLFENSVIPDSSLNFSSICTSSSVQDILGSAYREGNAGASNYSRIGQPMSCNRPGQQSWEPNFTKPQSISFDSAVLLPSFPAKNSTVGNENLTDNHNYSMYGVSKDSTSLLSNAVPNLGTVNDVQTVPYTGTCFQNSLYGYLDDSSNLLHDTGEADPQSRNFVKVYKSGSVGRSLDISRFSNYDELREELGQMYGIEGLLEDPLRSGWQLVFVDRENDVLLLGDDPWESFVNNVWYIKILSPEDVLKMGKQGVESFC
ncbi:hypothetical protein Cni_G15969 [Canna indica]|uniref:Auxin-responsive protein n=1 Tax=Canna indica TaxID=4628 RepID=A0AAQ3QGB9_9LILI|nr:hypothetical protein Cni_G15969 [Canna indica]